MLLYSMVMRIEANLKKKLGSKTQMLHKIKFILILEFFGPK